MAVIYTEIFFVKNSGLSLIDGILKIFFHNLGKFGEILVVSIDELIKRISTSIILLFILYLSINNHLILVSLLIIIGYFVMNESFFIFKKIAKKNKLFLFLTTLITLFYTVFY